MSKPAEEFHSMSDEELTIEVNRLRRHHYDLKSQMVTEKVEDPSQLHKTRKDIRIESDTNHGNGIGITIV